MLQVHDFCYSFSVNDLLAISQRDSDSELVVSWSSPEGHSDAYINQYYVRVTNYSLDLVANKTVPANTTSINITDLGKFFIGSIKILYAYFLHFRSFYSI